MNGPFLWKRLSHKKIKIGPRLVLSSKNVGENRRKDQFWFYFDCPFLPNLCHGYTYSGAFVMASLWRPYWWWYGSVGTVALVSGSVTQFRQSGTLMFSLGRWAHVGSSTSSCILGAGYLKDHGVSTHHQLPATHPEVVPDHPLDGSAASHDEDGIESGG